MKKILILAMMLAAVMMFAACTETPPPAEPEPPVEDAAPDTDVPEEVETPEEPDVAATGLEDKSLVVLTPTAAQGWIAAVIFFAEQAGNDLDIGSFRLLTSDSVAEQAGQIDEVISQNVDAIVLFPHSDELTLAAQSIIDAEIPLFVFNRNVDVDFNLRLLGSNLLLGGEGGRMIAEGIGGSGRVAYLAVPAVGSTSVERIGAFQDVMAEYPDIELVTMTANAISIEEGLRVTVDMLTANPEIDAIFTIDDQLAIGAYRAVREAGREDVQFIHGSGGMQDFFYMIAETDDINLTTGTFSPTMIADTIALAVEYLEGRRDFSNLFDPDFGQDNVVIFPPSIVTRDNVEQFFAPGSPW